MESRRVTFCVCEGAYPLMIENVPAQVCVDCNGEVFSAETVRVFEKVKDRQAPVREVRWVEVYDFDSARDYVMPVDGLVKMYTINKGSEFAAVLSKAQHAALFGKGEPIGERFADARAS